MANGPWNLWGLLKMTDEDKKAIDAYWEAERKEREAKREKKPWTNKRPSVYSDPIAVKGSVQVPEGFIAGEDDVPKWPATPTDDRTPDTSHAAQATSLNTAVAIGRDASIHDKGRWEYPAHLFELKKHGVSRSQLKRCYRKGWEQGNLSKTQPPIKAGDKMFIGDEGRVEIIRENTVNNYKIVTFHSADKAVAFADKYWDRVISMESNVSGGLMVKLGVCRTDQTDQTLGDILKSASAPIPKSENGA